MVYIKELHFHPGLKFKGSNFSGNIFFKTFSNSRPGNLLSVPGLSRPCSPSLSPPRPARPALVWSVVWRTNSSRRREGTLGFRSKCGLGGWGQAGGGLPQHMVCNCGLVHAEKGRSVMMMMVWI